VHFSCYSAAHRDLQRSRNPGPVSSTHSSAVPKTWNPYISWRTERLYLLPDSSSRGSRVLACLKPHSSITASFAVILSWRYIQKKPFHLSHPTPLSPLCWCQRYSCAEKWMGELTHIKEAQQETNKGPVSIWLSFLGGYGVCKAISLFPCTSTSERQDLVCQQHQLKPTEKTGTPSLDPVKNCAMQERCTKSPRKTQTIPTDKGKENLNWFQLDISHSFPAIVLSSIPAAHTGSEGRLPQPAASW